MSFVKFYFVFIDVKEQRMDKDASVATGCIDLKFFHSLKIKFMNCYCSFPILPTEFMEEKYRYLP